MSRGIATFRKFAGPGRQWLQICGFAAALWPVLVAAPAWSQESVAVPCIEVDIATLYGDPTPYMGERICTTAYIQVEYEAMALLPTPAPNNVPYSFEIGIAMRRYEALDLELRSFDRVAVEGTLLGNASCVTGTMLCWGAPIGFADPRVELVSRPDPWETCSHIPVVDLAAHPKDFGGEMICTEGVLTFAYFWIEMRSVDAPPDIGNADTIEISASHIRDGTELRLAGERISVAGYFDGIRLDAHEIRVEEARNIAEDCIETTVAEILAEPARFNFEPVCFSAFISPVEPGMVIVDLVPHVDPVRATHTRIYGALPRVPPFDVHGNSDAALIVRGVIAIDDWDVNDLPFEELEARYADDPIISSNANVPMTLMVYEIEPVAVQAP